MENIFQKGSGFRKASLITLSLALLIFPAPALAREIITVTGSIQEAINAANPGDIVVVPPGVYKESVLVDKDDITILGSRAAIIDASGLENGIRVGTGEITIDPSTGFPVCPPISVRNFTIDGLTITNAEENGILLVGVDGLRIVGGEYRSNAEYGPFARCSRNGLIDFNHAEGSDDAVIYVGNSDAVTVSNNHAAKSTIGIEIENSTNCIVRDNKTIGNTVGILVVVLPGLPIPLIDAVLIQRNEVIHNNRPNPIPPDSGDEAGLLPTGSGILNVGGDRVIIKDNVVMQNDSLGIGIIENPFAQLDPRIEPFPDNNQARHNTVLQNGKRPDPLRALYPGADIIFVTSGGTGNCFADNILKTEFPAGVTELYHCP